MRKMRLTVFCFVVAILAGCAATHNEIRQRQARYYHSNKTPDLVAACIFEGYDGAGAAKLIEILPRSDGGKTIRAPFGHVETMRFVVDISPTPSGSKFVFYENTLVNEFDRRYVATCGTPVAG